MTLGGFVAMLRQAQHERKTGAGAGVRGEVLGETTSDWLSGDRKILRPPPPLGRPRPARGRMTSSWSRSLRVCDNYVRPSR